MHDGSPPEGQTPVGKRLATMLLFLEAAAGDAARRFEAMAAGEGGSLTEAAKELVELRKWAGLAYEEQARIDKLMRDQPGGGAGRDIDFAAARDEIGRRLDRLRAAACAGELPG